MIRRAVSLALSPQGRPDQLLLVQRNPKLRSFGGVLAFPGGTLDDEDQEIRVEGLSQVDPTASEELAPFIVAGARELFEEVGAWLGRGGRTPDVNQLRTDRKQLLAEEVSFRALLERNDQHLDASDLVPMCHMMTPPFAPVRFDTWFLRGFLPKETPVEIWEGELVAGDYVDPASSLQAWRAGEVQLAPPMVVLLEEWSKGQDRLGERIRAMTDAYAQGKLHRVHFSPGILLAPLRTPTKPPATHTNTCIVGEEKLYLVDPSPVDPGEQSRLWALLDQLLEEGRKLMGILLTHYHPDHVGALASAQQRYDIPAYAHEDSISLLPSGKFGAPVSDGDVFDLGRAPDGSPDWKLRALHVPGHAPGHLAFQEGRYGASLVGDLVSTLSSILVDPSDGHLATYLRSLERLESEVRGVLYPGHGPAVMNGRRVIQKTLQHRREREEQLLSHLSDAPQRPAELVKQIYVDVDPKAHAMAERSLLSGLIKLEEEGRVVKHEDGYTLV